MKRRDRRGASNKGAEGMTEIARFGNFLIKRFGDGQSMWLRMMSVDGAWSMDFRDDSLNYGLIASCLESEAEGVRRALEAWIVVSYHMAQVWPDPEYLDEAVDCLRRLQERVSKRELEREKAHDKPEPDEVEGKMEASEDGEAV